ncbi:MAG: holo-ACP synthase [Gemmatimonadota bacterium]|nr:holo-ACP synthase [Gemmatimonadota bacterium]
MIVGIGIDLVDVARVERLLNSKGDRALQRLFTEAERTYAMRRAHPARHLAARIAAKEATFKALSTHPEGRAVGWQEMEVISNAGAPAVELHGLAARCAAGLGVTRVWLSLSHSDATAGAVVVLEGT